MLSLVLSMVLAAPVYVGATRFSDRVDLDRPGVLERIEEQDPQRYARIQGVIRAAEIEPCATLPKILQTQFRAELGTCAGYAILTSYPAKIHVTFSLEDTLYVTNVMQPKIQGKAWPAKERPESVPGKR